MLAGHGGPGVTGLQLLDSFSLDVLLDVIHETAVEELGRENVDQRLAELDSGAWIEEAAAIAVTRASDGKVVHITQKRIDQIRANRGKIVEKVGRR